jgi:hypothetical protein
MPDANAVEGDAIRTASAGDLPVQAVLDELEELLAHCPPRHLHTRTSSPSPSPTPSPPSGFSNSPADARVSLCNSTSAAGGLWTHSGQVSMICCQGGQVVPLADPACDSLLLCDMLQDHLQPQRPDCHASSNNATSDRQVEGPLASSEGCDDIRQEPLAAQSSQQPTAASPSSAGCYGNGSGATSPAIIEPNSKRPMDLPTSSLAGEETSNATHPKQLRQNAGHHSQVAQRTAGTVADDPSMAHGTMYRRLLRHSSCRGRDLVSPVVPRNRTTTSSSNGAAGRCWSAEAAATSSSEADKAGPSSGVTAE